MYSQHNNQSIIANKDLKAWVKILNTSSADAEKIMNAWMTNGTLAEVFAQAKQEKIPFLVIPPFITEVKNRGLV